MSFWDKFWRADVIWVVIPVIAIVMGGICSIVRQITRHRERIAMIEQGMHPDQFQKKNRVESDESIGSATG